MRIVQLSDMHFCAAGEKLYESIDINARNADIIHQLNSLPDPIDAVVITGDIADEGSSAQYQQVERVLSYLQVPVYMINGNHDHRENFIEGLCGICPLLKPGEPVRYAVETHSSRMLFIDSSVADETWGRVSRDQIDWLESQMATTDKTVVVFLHHPPLSMNSAHMDPIGCKNGDILLALADRYPHFTGIYCGHNHCFSITQYRQLVIAVAPACSVQIPVYQNNDTPLYRFSEPACLIHSVTDDGRWVSYQHSFDIHYGERQFPWVRRGIS